MSDGPLVVHVSSVHRAGDTRVLHRECRSLAQLYRVVLIARRDPAAVAPEGVTLDVFTPAGGRLGRVRNLVTVTRRAVARRADLYHLHDPELVVLAVVLRVLRPRACVVFDMHEDLPAQFAHKRSAARRSSTMAAFGRMIELAADRVAHRMVVADPANLPKYRRAVVVQNFPSRDEFPVLEREARSLDCVYVGSVSMIRGAAEMVDLAAVVGHEFGATVRIIGPLQPPSLADDLASREGAAHTSWLGTLDRKAVASHLAEAAVGLALLHDLPNYRNAQPTKVFEYLAAGLPVVASDLVGWRALFGDVDAVTLVDPMDAEAVAEAVRRLLTDADLRARLGAEGRAQFLSRWTWESEAHSLIELYRELLGVVP